MDGGDRRAKATTATLPAYIPCPEEVLGGEGGDEDGDGSDVDAEFELSPIQMKERARRSRGGENHQGILTKLFA